MTDSLPATGFLPAPQVAGQLTITAASQGYNLGTTKGAILSQFGGGEFEVGETDIAGNCDAGRVQGEAWIPAQRSSLRSNVNGAQRAAATREWFTVGAATSFCIDDMHKCLTCRAAWMSLCSCGVCAPCM